MKYLDDERASIEACEVAIQVVKDKVDLEKNQSGKNQSVTENEAALDNRYFELERLHGKKSARLAAESHAAAIDQIERIVREEKIACDFERVDGYLFVPPDESTEILEIELAAAQRAGLTDLEIIVRAPLGSFDTRKALRFPCQGQFHPLKYLAALAQAIIRDGGRMLPR